jgi:squalene synthase HpnC
MVAVVQSGFDTVQVEVYGLKQHLAELEQGAPKHIYTLAEADRYCAALSRGHYENFTVASWLLPRRLRKHFFSVSAYCRRADDRGDELHDRERSVKALEWWRSELDACYRGEPLHPVFVSLRDTITHFEIPRKPFDDLIDAFVQDQAITRYETYEQLLDYCKRSANPVGRLVLYLCGYSDGERQELSDYTCTALQLANFWQDVGRDLEIDRVYIPLSDMARYGCTYDDLFARRSTPAFRELMRFEVDRTRQLFQQGLPLIDRLDGSLRLDILLFSSGGMAILDKIEQQGWDVLDRRPSLSRLEKIRLTSGWLIRRLLHLS